ncbi:MAG TPA: DUF1592 domain-containing protein [Polyangia bacterium]
MALALGACTGSIGDGDSGGGDGTNPGVQPGAMKPSGSGSSPGGNTGAGGSPGGSVPMPAAACTPGAPDPGDAPLQLLTQEQYLNTLRDLFGNVDLRSVYPQANNASVLGLAQGDIDLVALENYQRAANLVATAVVGNKANLDKIAPCAVGTDGKMCARSFLQNFGAKIYRAPLAPADVDRHLPLYDAAVGQGYARGIEFLLRGMLQSPRFLYRMEFGTGEAVGSKAVKLSGYEVAARLSYALWKSTPDDALRAAAARGDLNTKEGVANELKRMLQDARGKAAMPRFLEDWVHLPNVYAIAKDGARFPEWNDQLRASMFNQARSFFDEIVNQAGGNLGALLTSSTTFVDKNLAGFYGMDAGAIADNSFMKTQRSGFEAGFFALPAFLAIQAKAGEGSPIYRGKFVREHLLCQELPAPPPDVPAAPDIKPGVSTRERLAQHVADPSCAGCHSLIDPIGLGFEHYDGIGRYRTMDAGKPVNAKGEVLGTNDANGAFVGVPELAAKLAKSRDLSDCMAKQWFRYAMARIEQPADKCSMESLLNSFRASNNDLRSLPLALVQTDAFLYRRPMGTEVKP